MKARTTPNQRMHPRSQVLGDRHHAATTRITLPDGRVLTGAVQDISAGGAAVVGDTEGLTVNSVVTITLHRPPDRADIRKCIVKRIEPGQRFDIAFVR